MDKVKQKRRKQKERKAKKDKAKNVYKKIYYSCMRLDLECDLYTKQTDVSFPTGINCK